MLVKEIIKQVVHGKVHVHVGKAGITTNFISQINNMFKKRMVIKVKLLNLMEFENAKQAFLHLSSLTNSKLVDVRGKTAVLLKTEHE